MSGQEWGQTPLFNSYRARTSFGPLFLWVIHMVSASIFFFKLLG